MNENYIEKYFDITPSTYGQDYQSAEPLDFIREKRAKDNQLDYSFHYLEIKSETPPTWFKMVVKYQEYNERPINIEFEAIKFIHDFKFANGFYQLDLSKYEFFPKDKLPESIRIEGVASLKNYARIFFKVGFKRNAS